MSGKSFRLAAMGVAAGVSIFTMFGFTCAQKKGGSGHGIKCTLVQLEDGQRSGGAAFTYLLPSGWTHQDSFKWNGNTYVAEMSAMMADKSYVVDRLEPMNMSYSASSGTQAQGVHMEKAVDFLHLLVNHMRQQPDISDVQILEEQNTDLPLTQSQKLMQGSRQIGGMSQSLWNQSAYLRVKFVRNGNPEVANMGTTVAGYNNGNHMQLGIGSTAGHFDQENDSYVVGPSVLIETPASPSAQKVKEVQIIASSAQITPPFALFCAKLAAEIAHIHFDQTQQDGKRLIQEMREHSEKTLEQYKEKWANEDKNTHDFCNYVLDQQDYKKSDGTLVTMPAYYNHGWANDQGQYFLSDDPTFDPRGMDNTNWEPMEHAIHGEGRGY